jgi:hypothetical protein
MPPVGVGANKLLKLFGSVDILSHVAPAFGGGGGPDGRQRVRAVGHQRAARGPGRAAGLPQPMRATARSAAAAARHGRPEARCRLDLA